VSDDTLKINGCICAHLPIIDNLPLRFYLD